MYSHYMPLPLLVAVFFLLLCPSANTAGDPPATADVTVRLLKEKEDSHEGGFVISMASNGTLWNLDGYKIDDDQLAKALREKSKGDSEKTRTVKVRVKEPSETSLSTTDKALQRIKNAAAPGVQTRILLIVQ